MTAFDYGVIAILGLSTALALWRGFLREAIALASWFAAFGAALAFAAPAEAVLAPVISHPGLRFGVAVSIVFVGTLIVGGFLGLAVSKLARLSGLGLADRLLGGVFGVVKGGVVVLAFVLAAGFTALPKQAWWRESLLAAPLAALVLELRPWLPAGIAGMLQYGHPRETLPAATGADGRARTSEA